MEIVPDIHENFNVLSVVDLIDDMTAYHFSQAKELAELSKWHEEQAQYLAAERRSLAADVDEALAEAERLLR